MRVAVHYDQDHPVHPGAVFAYRLGRIEEGVHNAAAGHEPVAIEEFVHRLIAQARAEFPDAKDVRLERLVDNGDGTSRWVADTEVTAEHQLVAGGQTTERQVTVEAEPAAQPATPAAAAPVQSQTTTAGA